MSLFDRMVEVFIVEKGKQTAIKVDQLRVTFDVQKKLETGKEGSNTCTVRIYNLSKTTRDTLHATAERLLILNAGYRDDRGTSVLYKGDIDLISHRFDLPDVVTVIECYDKGNLSTKLSLSFKHKTGAKSVLTQITNLMGSAIDTTAGISGLVDQIFNQGFSHSGTALEALNKVTAKINAQWSLQNGQLKFMMNGTTDQKQAFVLSPTTGLLDSPEREFQKKKKDDAGSFDQSAETVDLTAPVMNVKCLLNPKLEPGNKVEIVSREYDAAYKIVSVTHQGDTHGESWTSQLECMDV